MGEPEGRSVCLCLCLPGLVGGWGAVAGKLVLHVAEIVSLLIKRYKRNTLLGIFPRSE